MDIDSFLNYVVNAGSVLQNSSYETFAELPVWPHTNDPIWFLGQKYILPSGQTELEDDVQTRLWFTYRKNFSSIGGNGPTSDQGWGCMLRCGQMMLAQAIVCSHLGRSWRWRPNQNEESQEKFDKILSLFLDERDHTYSIHQIASMGESLGKPIGEWFGPSTIASALKKLSSYDKCSNLTIYYCMDSVIIASEIVNHCRISYENGRQHIIDQSDYSSNTDNHNGQSENTSAWKPLLLILPLRLGISEVNPIYYNQLKACFRLDQSVGVLGGKPSHAFWFVGYTEDNLLYFDPHTTQNKIDPNPAALHETYHVKHPNHTNIKELDPSMALGFFCKTEAEFQQLYRAFETEVIGQSANPICEAYVSRPRHLVDLYRHSDPKKATDEDNDDFEEFEII